MRSEPETERQGSTKDTRKDPRLSWVQDNEKHLLDQQSPSLCRSWWLPSQPCCNVKSRGGCVVRWVRYPAGDMHARVRRARAVSGALCLTAAPKIECIFFIPKRYFLIYNLCTWKDVFLQRVSKCWMYNLPSRKGGTEQGAGIEDPDQSVTSCQWAAESRHLEDEGDHGRWLGTLGESQQEAVSGVDNSLGTHHVIFVETLDHCFTVTKGSSLGSYS